MKYDIEFRIPETTKGYSVPKMEFRLRTNGAGQLDIRNMALQRLPD